MKKYRPAVAELIGTFCFVFIGAGSVVTNEYAKNSLGLVGIAIAHGLALSVMVSAFMAASGGQFNPAVSWGLVIAKKQKVKDCAILILAQLAGSAIAAYILRELFSPVVWKQVHLGTPGLDPALNGLTAFGVEAILSFVLMTAVLHTVVDSRAPKIGGFGVGLTVTAAILLAGPITGAAMNPARAFGPALLSGYWEDHWLYWVGPFLGASSAAWVYREITASPPAKD